MKTGNIALRVGIESTSPAFQANVLTITPPRLPDVSILPMPTCLCGSLSDYYTHPPGIIRLLMLTITYIQAMTLHNIHIQGRFNNHTAHSLYKLLVMATRL